MGTQREEIVVKAGFDNTALASGLRQAEGMVSGFSKSVKSAITGIFASVSIAGFISMIDRAFKKVKDIQSGSAKTGIGVEEYQRLSQTAQEEMIDGAMKFQTAITKLNVEIGEGSKMLEKWGIHSKTAESAMYEIADKMKSMTDPAERAAMAFDLMGRQGTSMIPLLERGSAALKEMASHQAIFSKEDMQNISDAHKEIDQMENRVTIWAGKFISAIAATAQVAGASKLFGGEGNGVNIQARVRKDWQDQLDSWHKQNEAQMDAADAKEKSQTTQVDLIKKAGDAEARAAEESKIRATQEEKINSLKERGLELENQQSKLMQERNKVLSDINKIDQETPSIADLAGRGFTEKLNRRYGKGGQFDIGLGNGPFGAAARDYELAQKQQIYDIIQGNAKFDQSGALVGGAAFEDKRRMISAHNLLAGAGLDTPAMKLEEANTHLQEIQNSLEKVSGSIDDNELKVKIASQ